MTDLTNYGNIYANLSQSSYNGRKNLNGNPYNFANALTKRQQKKLQKGKSVEFNFNKAKDFYGNDASKVFLQPDPTVKVVKDETALSFPILASPIASSTYHKGLLTDEKAGFNAYFVTDTPKLNEKTKNAYFVTRGSDAAGVNTLNDWWSNNASFTLKDAYIPQAQLATKALQTKIKEMKQQAPQAKISITGHSLGTMVSIQAIANLPASDIEAIERVVLFQGPDARASIQKMSKEAQMNIKHLEAAGKIDYYVNPFDLVSMLNRNQKGVDEIGNIHYLLPKSYTTTFDRKDKNGSSHDFGQYQMNADGTLKVATLKDHPEIFAAGQKLSAFIDQTLTELERVLIPGVLTAFGVLSYLMTQGSSAAGLVIKANGKLTYAQAKAIYNEYVTIIETAKIESQRKQTINYLQTQIQATSGSQKIQYQEALVREVAAQAAAFGEEYQAIVANIIDEAEAEIDQVAQEVETAAWTLQHYLPVSEVEAMIADFRKEALWDAVEAASIKVQTRAYRQQLNEASDKLNEAATKIKDADQQAAKLFQK